MTIATCCWQHCSCVGLQHCKTLLLTDAACWSLLEALQHCKLQSHLLAACPNNEIHCHIQISPALSMAASSLLAWPNDYNKNSTLENFQVETTQSYKCFNIQLQTKNISSNSSKHKSPNSNYKFK